MGRWVGALGDPPPPPRSVGGWVGFEKLVGGSSFTLCPLSKKKGLDQAPLILVLSMTTME